MDSRVITKSKALFHPSIELENWPIANPLKALKAKPIPPDL